MNRIEEGEAFFHEGKIEKARTCFLGILEEDPYCKEAKNNLGVIAFKMGEMEKAIDFVTQALVLDPFYKEAILNFSEVLRAMGQLHQILPFLDKVVRRYPDDEHFANLLSEVKSQNQVNRNGRARLAQQDNRKAFFVLSTGRCGTYTLAQLLSLSHNAKAYHYPKPQLLQEGLHAYWGDIDKRGIFWSGRSLMMQRTWAGGYIYGETSPFITPFCDLLSEDLPESRFIVLIRHPKDFVRSGLRQNFYHGHPLDVGLLRPSPKTEAFKAWEKKSQFEKLCWLWNETYIAIQRMLEKVQKERVLLVRFEDLISRIGTVHEIFQFLSLEGFCEGKITEVLAAKLNSQEYRRFPEPESWSPDLNDIVKRCCEPTASHYGYPLLDEKPSPRSSSANTFCSSPSVVSHKEHPTVSVGLPLYSGGTNLADAIESILSQDYEDIELIISDHGSDPFVREVCHHYQRMDGRLKYYPTGDQINYLGIHNLARMIELSHAPYFMWGSYDDQIEKSFIRKCLAKVEEDESIALAYPRSKILDRNSRFLGIGDDTVKADQNDPFERFKHVIWELKLCNAFYGLMRRHILRKTRSLRKNAYAHDNLFLAEIALLGKIVQIEDVLFIRQLKRDYHVPLDRHHADVLYSADPQLLEEGISLPFCRLTYAHCELINHSTIEMAKKEEMTREIVHCFRSRWGRQLRYEIMRAIQLVNQRCFYQTWDGRAYNQNLQGKADYLQYFHVTDVLKCLREALFIYPEWAELREAYATSVQVADHLVLGDQRLPAAVGA